MTENLFSFCCGKRRHGPCLFLFEMAALFDAVKVFVRILQRERTDHGRYLRALRVDEDLFVFFQIDAPLAGRDFGGGVRTQRGSAAF